MHPGDPKRLTLESAVKAYDHAQDKTEDPLTTVTRAVARLVQIEETADVELVERQGSVAGAYAFSSPSAFYTASGKGLSAEQARASAVMELVERYSWLTYAYDRHPDYLRTTFRELCRRDVKTVAPAYFLCNFGGTANREALTEAMLDIPLKWVTGTELGSSSPFYYPINWHNLVFSSNGLAAGNCIEEAIVQGLCEVIERENVFRFFFEQRPGVAVDLDEVEQPLIRTVVENARAARIDLCAMAIGGELGIPTFVVRGTRLADFGQLTFEGVGQGCHPDPVKALMRALSEYFEGYTSTKALQSRAALKWSLLPKGIFGFHALHNAEVFSRATDTVRLGDLESLGRTDFRDEIHLLVARLARHGYQVVVVDKTHPQLGIPVVRVVVPGMRCCIGGNCADPSAALLTVSHESGDPAAIERFGGVVPIHDAFAHLLAQDAALAQAMPTLGAVMAKRGDVLHDYRDTMKFWQAFRKAVIADFRTFAQSPLMAGAVEQAPKSLHQRILSTLPVRKG
jgi:ribosomal protein S12 methylthiotransferase accessory factor